MPKQLQQVITWLSPSGRGSAAAARFDLGDIPEFSGTADGHTGYVLQYDTGLAAYVTRPGFSDAGDVASLTPYFRLGYGPEESISIDWGYRMLMDEIGNYSVQWGDRVLMDASNISSAHWGDRTLGGSAGLASLNWADGVSGYDADGILWGLFASGGNRTIFDGSGAASLDADGRALYSGGFSALAWGDGISGYDANGYQWGSFTSEERKIFSVSGEACANFGNYTLVGDSGVDALDWFNHLMYGAWSCNTLSVTTEFKASRTVTPGGTTGNRTINLPSGTVNFAAGATTVVVTNSLVSANSFVFATVRTNDTTASIKNVIPASGSFTIRLSAAATAETSVAFLVTN